MLGIKRADGNNKMSLNHGRLKVIAAK